jgi:hypothetical protein
MESLSNANTGIGTWDSGWLVQEIIKTGTIKISKSNYPILYVQPKQFRIPHESLQIGERGNVFMPKEWRQLNSGFYTAFGNATDEQEQDILVRIYWNSRSSGAIKLLRLITNKLNQNMIPFVFKIINDPKEFTRSDAAVLYIHKKYLEESADIIIYIYEQIKNFINPYNSIFVKRLANGLGLAEDSNDYNEFESFGQNRCRILAKSIISAQKLKNPMDKIVCDFQKEGIDIHKPYLNKGSKDDYDKFFNNNICQ